MFDINKILHFLLKNAYELHRVSYTHLYEIFNVNIHSQVTLDIFHDALEKAEIRIIKELLHNDNVPLYSSILYHEEDQLPDITFYDLFAQLNVNLYQSIAGKMIVPEVYNYPDLKKEIHKVATELLVRDLNNRFPDYEALELFIETLSSKNS